MNKKCFLGLCLFVLMLSGCTGEKKGPEDIMVDRDECELCVMILSNPEFMYEVRGGENKRLYKFDDIGCALRFMEQKNWLGDEAVEIWATDFRKSSAKNQVWLNAREAFWVGGLTTPMDDKYGATEKNEPEAISYVEMKNLVLADRHRREKEIAERKKAKPGHQHHHHMQHDVPVEEKGTESTDEHSHDHHHMEEK